MQKEYRETAPIVDEAGDLWISRKWLLELLPELRPGEFLYLACHLTGIRGIAMSDPTKFRTRRRLHDKGLL